MSKPKFSRIEHLEALIKYHDEHFIRLGKEVEICCQQIGLISGWISTRFGVNLLPKNVSVDYNQILDMTKGADSQEEYRDGKDGTDLKIMSNVIKTSKSKPNSLHQRSLKIVASMRKRRRSSMNQKSQTNSNNTTLSSINNVQEKEKCASLCTEAIPVSNETFMNKTENNFQTAGDETKIISSSASHESNKGNNLDYHKSVKITSNSNQRGRPKKQEADKKKQPKNSTPMVCDQCGKVLKSPSSLRSHKLIHTNERPYKCHYDLCSKAFRMKHHLDFHLLTHDDGGKKWTCKFCNKGFIAQRDLLRHERTHTGEKPFMCPFQDCLKRFNVKQHLTLHSRTHTGERPYTCLTCNKRFSQANSLRIHKKIHAKSN